MDAPFGELPTDRKRGSHPGRLVLLALLCGLGCQSAPAPETATPIERVVKRLDASFFPGLPTPPHGPVAQIGDEARAVISANEEILVAEAFGVVPKEGRARAEIEWSPELAQLPENVFRLTTQELPFAPVLDQEVLAQIARQNFSLRRDRGWRLDRNSETEVAFVEIEHTGNQEVQINFRLTALNPVPKSLESRSFDIPAKAQMQLGFGLANTPEKGEDLAVEFRATLNCPDQDSRLLIDHRLSLESANQEGWQDVLVDLDEASNCKLQLENHVEGNAEVRGAVWAVPQILAPEASPRPGLNLVLISLDTLRSDHLSGLGYPRETSPTIDREFMGGGTTFTDVSSTFPQTDVSHLSIFTGLYPLAQPVQGRVSAQDRLVLLAERLQKAGFETAAFTENALVSGAFGFWFGFDQFTERSFAHSDRGGPTISDGIRYIEANQNRLFFLFLHTYKTHDPYVPSASYEKLWSAPDTWKDGGHRPWIHENHRDTMDRYDRTIREADDLVGQFLEALDRLGLRDRTLIVVTSDHGEAFGEHGIGGHGFTPHQEALNVPLLMRGPGIPAGLRIDTPVSIVDIAPTMLDLLELEPLSQSQGVSLKPALEGTSLDPTRPLFFSWLRPQAAGVRKGNLKYHQTDKLNEKFDLRADPNEWKPDRSAKAKAEGKLLLDDHEKEAAELRQSLSPGQNAPIPAPAIDERLEKSLEALGYL